MVTMQRVNEQHELGAVDLFAATGDSELPDFLELAGAQTDAEFAAASSTAAADGGLLVFPGAVLVISGDRHNRIPIDDIVSWELDDGDATFLIAVISRAGDRYTATLPSGFRAPTVSALDADIGPAANQD